MIGDFMTNTNDCDKCGLLVLPENDALVFAMFYREEPETADYDGETPILGLNNACHRHLFPVFNKDGEIVCAGSPSRAQYVGGFSDTRCDNGYYSEYYAPGFKRAFGRFREVYPSLIKDSETLS